MSLPPSLRNLLSLVLVLFLMPGLTELVETVEHLFHDGHMPHGEQHEHDQHAESHDGTDEEHGCTTLAHNCSCHISAPAVLNDADADDPTRWLAVVESRPIILEQALLSWANAPPTRPPIFT